MNIFVVVKPKSREEKVVKVDDNHYVVHTKVLPENGKANIAVVKTISKYLHIPQSHAIIISGFTSRQKIMQILTP